MAYRLGVDLGTSFTAAAVVEAGRVEVVQLGDHAPQVPSAIFRTSSDAFLVGEPAIRAGLADPGRLAKEFKRRFGDDVNILMGGAPMPPHLLTAKLLRWVVSQVSQARGAPPDSVTISHPANWGAYRLELLRQAADEAGVANAALCAEPEAAAVHFASGDRVTPGRHIAVYDLGGGTFDAAVLRGREDGSFEIVGTPQGIEHLGGIDFDGALLDLVQRSVDLSGVDTTDPVVLMELTKLRRECTDAKESLSADSDTGLAVAVGPVRTIVRLNRADFEAAIRPAIEQTVATLERTIERAGVSVDDLEAVVLVGGSSRVPLVTETLVEALGRPVRLSSHPKHCVALGAAILADRVARRADPADDAPTAAPALVPRRIALAREARSSRTSTPVDVASAARVGSLVRDESGTAPVGRRRRTLVLAGALAAVVVGGAFAVAQGMDGGDGTSSGPTVSTSTTAVPSTTTSTSTSSSSPSSSSSTSTTPPPPASTTATRRDASVTNAQALAQLDAMRRGDASRVAGMLDGRWVAQLSSKSDGITDPLQTTASGSHTFRWTDILREVRALRGNADFGPDVVTLLSTEFGNTSTWRGKPLYVTVADEEFDSAASVDDWCASTFPALSDEQRANACAARRLTAPDGGGGVRDDHTSAPPHRAGAAVMGHVRSSTGEGLAGYTVEFKHYPDCPGICQQIFTTTDRAGSYSLNLPDGFYIALCVEPADALVNCTADGADGPHLVEVPPRGQTVNFTAHPL